MIIYYHYFWQLSQNAPTDWPTKWWSLRFRERQAHDTLILYLSWCQGHRLFNSIITAPSCCVSGGHHGASWGGVGIGLDGGNAVGMVKTTTIRSYAAATVSQQRGVLIAIGCTKMWICSGQETQTNSTSTWSLCVLCHNKTWELGQGHRDIIYKIWRGTFCYWLRRIYAVDVRGPPDSVQKVCREQTIPWRYGIATAAIRR